MDWKLELVVIPVSDVDRAKAFYTEKARLQRRPRPHRERRDPLRAAHAAWFGVLDRLRPRTRGRCARFGEGPAGRRRRRRERRTTSWPNGAWRSATSRYCPGARSCTSTTPTATTGPCSNCRRALRTESLRVLGGRDDLWGVPRDRLDVRAHVADSGSIGRETSAHDRVRGDQTLEGSSRSMSTHGAKDKHSEWY